MPGDMYLKNPETVTGWKFGLTTVDWRKKDLTDRLNKSRKLAAGEEEVELKASGEEGINLIKALCDLERVVSNVNIPNTYGQIGNLPRTAVVEGNALFEKGAVRPLYAGNLPEKVQELILPHVENHEYVLEAALTCNEELVLKAFLQDPLVKGKKTEAVKSLVKDMIENTMKYLPEGWKK